jgi:hypothetical protein
MSDPQAVVVYTSDSHLAEIIVDCMISRLRAYKRQDHSSTGDLRKIIESAVLVNNDNSTIPIGKKLLETEERA